jgi:hypothetical protein
LAPLPREDVDLLPDFDRARLDFELLRDFVDFFRAGFRFAATRETFFAARRRAGLDLETRAAAFFTAGRSFPSFAAFPAIAPTTPPMTAPAGPMTLPSAAPATAPAVSLGIGGTSIFSLPLELFGIKSSSIKHYSSE